MRFFKKRPQEPDRFLDLKPRTHKQRALVDLKPPFVKRYQRPIAAGLAVLVAFTLGYTRFFTQASAAYFYPDTCLGTWRYADRAEDKPQASAPGEVQPSASAFFDESAHEIYCGGFEGEVPEGTTVTKMELNMLWRVSYTELKEEIKVKAEPTPEEVVEGQEGSSIPSEVLDASESATVEFEIHEIKPDGKIGRAHV